MVGTDNVTYSVTIDSVPPTSTYESLPNKPTVAMDPNPTAVNDTRYRYNDFIMTLHGFNQSQQNEFADYIGKPECKDQDFRTLVSWMGCVGADFDITFENYLKGLNVSHRTQFTSIIRAATLGADGVWQIQFKHHEWGHGWYRIIK